MEKNEEKNNSWFEVIYNQKVSKLATCLIDTFTKQVCDASETLLKVPGSTTGEVFAGYNDMLVFALKFRDNMGLLKNSIEGKITPVSVNHEDEDGRLVTNYNRRRLW
jgi:hypothetical protein